MLKFDDLDTNLCDKVLGLRTNIDVKDVICLKYPRQFTIINNIIFSRYISSFNFILFLQREIFGISIILYCEK